MTMHTDRLESIYPLVLADIKELTLTVRDIAKKYRTSTAFIANVARENGVDMNARKGAMRAMKYPPRQPSYRFSPKYKQSLLIESMSGDGMSLQWLTRKW